MAAAGGGLSLTPGEDDVTKSAYRLTPWADVARPHPDVVGGALDMGVYAANLASVFRDQRGVSEVYARPDRFFAATYFTESMRRLLGDVLGVLSGRGGSKVIQLRTPFGGGKTHTLLSLLHLVRSPKAAVGVPELEGLPKVEAAQVAVLSGEELDPVAPYAHPDGMETRTLWGELGWQLGRYDLVAEHDRAGSAPGGDVLGRVLDDGPVLILLDEVLVYVEKAMAVARGESTAGRQAMLFLQALTEVVNGHPRAAMVYSLQASVGEAAGAEGLLSDLDHLVGRIDAKREPVTGDDVLRVVQRRLFESLGDPSVHREVARAYADLVRRQLQAQAETEDLRREADVEAQQLEARILESYPFHPAQLDLMYHRWGSLPSYQRTRGALQFLASVVHALWERRDGSALVGPGEVDLSDEAVRGAFFSQVGERERYTSVLDGDVVSEGSGAAVVDRRIGADAPALERLRVGTRLATAIMLYSFGTREGEERGVLESDLVAATLVPGLDRNVIVAGLHDLREEELFLHYTGRRYRFDPKPNLTKLVRDEKNKFTAEEVLALVREELESQLRGARHVVIWPQDPGSMPDRVPAFTLAYLAPDWTREAEPLTEFVEKAGASRRTYQNAVGFALPDVAQFDRARDAARTRLAAKSLLDHRARYGFGAEQVEELKEKLEAATRDLQAAVKRSYSHAALPVRAPSGDKPYVMEEVDLRSLLAVGSSLHERTMEALSHRVFNSITVDKLISLAGLGGDRPAVACSDLVDWFFTFFEFTKLTDKAAIADAISRAVMEGRCGYAVGVVETEGTVKVRDPDLVRRGGMLPTAEIDLSSDAAILTSEAAEHLIAEAVGEKVPGVPPKGPELGEEEAEASDKAGEHELKPTDAIRSAALRITVEGGDGLFALNRVLSWLRDQSAAVEVEVTLRATGSGDGFDRVRFRNGVIEPIEEAGGEIKSELS